MLPMTAIRSRSRYGLGTGFMAVILLGLASRKYPFLFPAFLGKYPGDALWALTAFIGFGLLSPGASASRLAGLAFTTSCLVEFSQLYHAPWLNAIRATTPGHLLLGTTFSWLDICAYSVGVALGVVLDVAVAGAAKRFTGRSTGQPPPAPELGG